MVIARIRKTDELVAARLASIKPPRLVRYAVVFASRGGDGGLWVVVWFLLASCDPRPALRAFVAGFVAASAALALFLALKRLIRRPRPSHVHVWSSIAAPDRFSFPSGHSMVAAAVCVSLARFYPHAWPYLLVFSAGVALSRLVLSLHYLTDVIAGLALGSILGWLGAFIVSAHQ